MTLVRLLLMAVLLASAASASAAGLAAPVILPDAESPVPSASNTGVNANDCPDFASKRTTRSGLDITPAIAAAQPNRTWENYAFTSGVTVSAPNVTIRCSTITASGSRYGIQLGRSGAGDQGADLLVENVEITGSTSAGAMYWGPGTLRKAYIHDVQGDGIKLKKGSTVEGSFVTRLILVSGSHNDALQLSGPGSNTIIRNNNLEGPFQQQTSAIIMQPTFGEISNVLIEGNRLHGGTFTITLGDHPTSGRVMTNVRIRNNTWANDSWKFGPMKGVPGVSRCGNVFSNGASFDDPC